MAKQKADSKTRKKPSPLAIVGAHVTVRDMWAFTLLFPHLPQGLKKAARLAGMSERQASTTIKHVWVAHESKFTELQKQISSGGDNIARRVFTACKDAVNAIVPSLETLNHPWRVKVAGCEARSCGFCPKS